MKQFIIFLLIAVAVALTLSLTACGGDTDDINWNGVYAQTGSYQADWMFMEITGCDGGSFRFEFYSRETADSEKLIYLDGAATAVIRSDDSYKADYKGITFSVNAESGEITVEGSDYGVADGTYAREEVYGNENKS